MVQHENEAVVGNAQVMVVVNEVAYQAVAAVVDADHGIQPDAVRKHIQHTRQRPGAGMCATACILSIYPT